MQDNVTIFSGTLATFVEKFLRFLEENLIIFRRKYDDFCKKG